MKKFLVQCLFFTILLTFCIVGILSFADGRTDPFYLRFTTPKQTSLVIGSSRAAQGFQPAIFKKVLNEEIFNYSFSVDHSPYGLIYFESIKKKLLIDEEKNGLFVITVDPWGISSITENPNDFLNFREISFFIDNTKIVNINPNPIYLFHNLSGEYRKILVDKSKTMLLHDDGWLEVTVPMDSSSLQGRIENKMQYYRTEKLPFHQYSSYRLNVLQEIIEHLSQQGDVFLVRLPVHPLMMEIENELMPEFNRRIEPLIPLSKGYYDMTDFNESFEYTDGNHLEKKSGKRVTRQIAEWITEIRSQH